MRNLGLALTFDGLFEGFIAISSWADQPMIATHKDSSDPTLTSSAKRGSGIELATFTKNSEPEANTPMMLSAAVVLEECIGGSPEHFQTE